MAPATQLGAVCFALIALLVAYDLFIGEAYTSRPFRVLGEFRNLSLDIRDVGDRVGRWMDGIDVWLLTALVDSQLDLEPSKFSIATNTESVRKHQWRW